MADGIIGAGGGMDKLAKLSPNGRLGRPEDVAAAVVYLCSRGSGHVNGDTIVLDGGKMLAGAQL
jgi:NAD(P)-dependent dehydrogenase (short-subunit alcohol dehydrogenase family)